MLPCEFTDDRGTPGEGVSEGDEEAVNEHQQWPALDHQHVKGTLQHLHRLSQIAGKYTLTDLFEPGWGSIVLDVTARGLRTPTLRQHGTTFEVHYRLHDGDVIIETESGSRTLQLRSRSVAEFFVEFGEACDALAMPSPGSPLACEIPDGVRLDLDTEHREWDPVAAKDIWAALNRACMTWSAPGDRWWSLR